MPRITTRREFRTRRHLRVRTKVQGTTTRPRLAVFRSLNHIYAQVIDDDRGHTVAAASSLEPEIRPKQASEKKASVAQLVGALVAERAKAVGVSQVVFDRGGNQYQGRVRALADAARSGGLVF